MVPHRYVYTLCKQRTTWVGALKYSRYVEDVHTTNAHHNAAQIGNEPLGGVEAENTDSVEPLQSQSDQRLCRSRDLGIVLLERPRLPLTVSLCPTTRESNSYKIHGLTLGVHLGGRGG